MREIEVFFDYLCPFCDRGIRQFLDLLPEYPDVSVIWRPCEAHPRPESARIHSDLAIQTFFCLQEAGGDLIRYHRKIFDTWFRGKKRIDEVGLLSAIAADCGAEEAKVRTVLQENRYAKAVEEENRYAWEEKNLCAVPSYICGEKTALSRNGRLVPLQQVRDLLAGE